MHNGVMVIRDHIEEPGWLPGLALANLTMTVLLDRCRDLRNNERTRAAEKGWLCDMATKTLFGDRRIA